MDISRVGHDDIPLPRGKRREYARKSSQVVQDIASRTNYKITVPMYVGFTFYDKTLLPDLYKETHSGALIFLEVKYPWQSDYLTITDEQFWRYYFWTAEGLAYIYIYNAAIDRSLSILDNMGRLGGCTHITKAEKRRRWKRNPSLRGDSGFILLPNSYFDIEGIP